MLLPTAALSLHTTPLSALKIFLRKTALAYVLLGLAPLFLKTVVAQEIPSDDEVIRVTTDLLLFPVRMRDNHGKAVTGLTERDLSLTDDDRVASGLYFSPGTDRVALVFALDQSGSLRDIISQQQDAALALFARFSARSSIAVLRFSETATLVAPFGRDTESARAAFKFPTGLNQHTAIFDAASSAIQTFDDLPPVRAERRIVVLISDGLDNASNTKPGNVINSALEKHVSFYVIHLPLYTPRDGRLAVRQPTKGFRDLAEKTGGKYFLVGDPRAALLPQSSDLSPIFQAIEEDLKSQYLLGFYIGASSRDGRNHVFSVTLKPSNVQYSTGKLGYARTHKFSVNLAPNTRN